MYKIIHQYPLSFLWLLKIKISAIVIEIQFSPIYILLSNHNSLVLSIMIRYVEYEKWK